MDETWIIGNITISSGYKNNLHRFTAVRSFFCSLDSHEDFLSKVFCSWVPQWLAFSYC